MTTAGPSSPLSVLYVEDHADTAEVFTQVLQVRGFRVQHASNCQTAVALACRSRFDLLLCDIILPDGNGCDLLKALRQQAGQEDMRAIAFSAHGVPISVARAQAAGFDAYVLKPAHIGELFRLIEEIWSSPLVHSSSPRSFITLGIPNI